MSSLLPLMGLWDRIGRLAFFFFDFQKGFDDDLSSGLERTEPYKKTGRVCRKHRVTNDLEKVNRA